LLFVSFLLVASANAQVTGGTIKGVITDASGAVISEAQVTVTESDTQVSRRIAVNRECLDSAPNLRPGTYSASDPSAGSLVFDSRRAAAG
jgi:hypothetical protein